MRITGADKAARRFKRMEQVRPKVIFAAVTDVMHDIERQAKLNVTGGNPLYVRSGRGRASITSRVRRRGKSTIGETGSNVFYMKTHELGEPKVIRPKSKPYLRFQAGRGMSPASHRSSGRWVTTKEVRVKKRPWLSKAVKQRRNFRHARLARIPRDMVKAVK